MALLVEVAVNVARCKAIWPGRVDGGFAAVGQRFEDARVGISTLSAISKSAAMCGSSASAPAKSCACPGVSSKRNGLPSASTSAWIFVLSPPRLRPRASFWSFFGGVGTVLMGAHDIAVEHRIFVVGIGGQMLKDVLPDPRFQPIG